jgi:uncharacterized protein GlcG (DUF336 family)
MKTLKFFSVLATLTLSLIASAQTQAPASAATTPPAAPVAGSSTATPASGAPRPPQAPPARGPALDLAIEAAQIAISTCATNGFKVAAVVQDSAGGIKALLIGDGAGSRLADIVPRKGNAVIAFKMSSGKVGDQAKTDTDLAAKIAAEPTKYFARAGGVPLMVNGEMIGAFSVGGAPDSAQDEICTLAGLAKIQARLK